MVLEGDRTMKTAYVRGDTFRVRETLKSHGWSWNAEEKAWTKRTDWESEKEVENTIRGYVGIRNRGSFHISFDEAK